MGRNDEFDCEIRVNKGNIFLLSHSQFRLQGLKSVSSFEGG